MNTGVFVDKAEQIKWWDALDAITAPLCTAKDVQEGFRLARACLHPDAQWLVALVPKEVAVTKETVVTVMLAQGEDPRALFIASRLGK